MTIMGVFVRRIIPFHFTHDKDPSEINHASFICHIHFQTSSISKAKCAYSL